MYFIYNMLWIILLILASPYMLVLALLGKERIKDRLGWPALNTKSSIERPIWIHAASVGEIAVVASLVPELKKVRPRAPIAVSTTTTTGLSRARQIVQEADFTFAAPLDTGWCVRRVFRQLDPTALLLVETELWPHLIRSAKRNGCAVAIVNGRLTDRGYPRYQRFKGIVSRILTQIDFLCVQSEKAKARFVALGAPLDRIGITGNVKIDLLKGMPADVQTVRQDLRIPAKAKVIVAGCTREGEEPILLDGFIQMQAQLEPVVFVLAPRHLRRVPEIERELKKRDLSYVKRSQMGPQEVIQPVLLLNTMGELSRVYAAADVAFVGGSLVIIGGRGHNPLEPAALGVPVLFGPYMQQEGSEALLKSGAAIQIDNANQFAKEVTQLLENPNERRRRGAAGQKVIQDAQGAARRTVELLVHHGIL